MMNDPKAPHIVSAFDKDLTQVRKLIHKMGSLAAAQINQAVTAFVTGDTALAETVINADKQLDDLEQDIGDKTVQLIALRQPMADDLRLAISALKIASSIERIGDYAKNCAKRTRALNNGPSAAPVFDIIADMGAMAKTQMEDALSAFEKNDAATALQVWKTDAMLDGLHNRAHQSILLEMQRDADLVHDFAHLLFMAKNLERIGDHCTNIAEEVHYFVTGHGPEDDRPKADTSSDH